MRWASLQAKEYPTLVPPGQVADTIAVPAVLAVFNWQKKHRPIPQGAEIRRIFLHQV